ncbi:MAG: hypothetical protein R2862_02730 [Thermoanaerobaculia bacterium]
MMKTNRQRVLGATAVVLLLAGCATTRFTSIWKAPDAQPLQFRSGDPIVAMVVAEATALRRAGEANVADELDKRGFKGIPAYTLISDSDIKDETKARAAIEGSGAKGVIVLRPVGTEQKVSSTPSTYYGAAYYGRPYYGSFWGGGYYGYARRVLPEGRWGAPELVARISHVDLDDGPVRGGSFDRIYFGFDWWATQRWKVGIGWGRTRLDRFDVTGTTESLLTRVQWVF